MGNPIKFLIALSLIIIRMQSSGDAASAPLQICSPGPCDCSNSGTINCDGEGLTGASVTPESGIDPNRIIDLSMNSNRIVRVQRLDIFNGKTARLTKLSLNGNLMNQIDDGSFVNMSRLELLDLRNNKLTALTERTFDGLSNLLDLRLDNNLFQDLSKAIFASVPKLRYLTIDFTPLKKISNQTFSGLDSLIELSIDHAELSTFPLDAFKSLIRLETLSLRHNRFSVIPQDQLHWLVQLKRLDLSGNPIKAINSNAFRHNTHLHFLTFYNMPELNYVEDCAFCNLHQLSSLEIVNCSKFNDIDPEAFGRDHLYFQSLVTIDLENNSLTVLDEDMLLWENVSGVIKLAGNPWKCDCEIAWMTNKKIKFDEAQPPTCYSPPRLKGQQITAIQNTDSTFCILIKLGSRIRTARLFLTLALVVVLAGAATTVWYLFINRRNIKIRNLFYKPQLPKYAYRNLAMGDDVEPDPGPVVTNDGAAILNKNANKVNRDLASRLAED